MFTRGYPKKITQKSVSKCWTSFSMHLRHFLGPDLLHPLGWSPCRIWAGWPSSKERQRFETWRLRKSWGIPNHTFLWEFSLWTITTIINHPFWVLSWLWKPPHGDVGRNLIFYRENFSKVRHNHRNQQNMGYWVWLHPQHGGHRMNIYKIISLAWAALCNWLGLGDPTWVTNCWRPGLWFRYRRAKGWKIEHIPHRTIIWTNH